MVDKENPASQPASDTNRPVDGILVPERDDQGDQGNGSSEPSDIVTAELVERKPVLIQPAFSPTNLAARGGAVASVVLGAWSILGAMITSYSVVNALLGLALGSWGMSSNIRWAWLGIALSLAGIVFCAITGAAR